VGRYTLFRSLPATSSAIYCTGARHVTHHIVCRCPPHHPPRRVTVFASSPHSVPVLATSSIIWCTGTCLPHFLSCLASHDIIPFHLTSHDKENAHRMSHDITRRHTSSKRITPHHTASHPITPHVTTSRLITLHHITPHHAT